MAAVVKWMLLPKTIELWLRAGLVLALMSGAIFLCFIRPARTTDDERMILRAVTSTSFVGQPAACIGIYTSPSMDIDGSGYWTLDMARNEAIASVFPRARGRDRVLMTWAWRDVSVKDLIGGLWDRIGCSAIVKLGTPRISGKFAFVGYEEGTAWGAIALERVSGGWRYAGSVSHSKFERII